MEILLEDIFAAIIEDRVASRIGKAKPLLEGYMLPMIITGMHLEQWRVGCEEYKYPKSCGAKIAQLYDYRKHSGAIFVSALGPDDAYIEGIGPNGYLAFRRDPDNGTWQNMTETLKTRYAAGSVLGLGNIDEDGAFDITNQYCFTRTRDGGSPFIDNLMIANEVALNLRRARQVFYFVVPSHGQEAVVIRYLDRFKQWYKKEDLPFLLDDVRQEFEALGAIGAVAVLPHEDQERVVVEVVEGPGEVYSWYIPAVRGTGIWQRLDKELRLFGEGTLLEQALAGISA